MQWLLSKSIKIKYLILEMTINIDEIARTLAACQEYEISALHWDEHRKAALAHALKKYTDEPFKVYRLLRKEQGETLYLLCLDSHQTAKACEAEYRQASFLRRSVPFLLLFTLFLLTAFFAKYKDAFLSATFLISMPFVMGALFEYVRSVSSKRVASVKNVLKTQLWVMLIILVISIFVLKEGTICVIMALPLLFAALVIGALLMRSLCQYLWKPTNKIYSLALLPLLLIGFLPKHSPDQFGKVERKIVINAPIQQTFDAISDVQKVQDHEIAHNFIFTMGFPKPMLGQNEATQAGLLRHIYWQRGIYFQEKVTRFEPPYVLAWKPEFNKASFPQGSLDDHIEIGGQYFDVLSSEYRLVQISPQQTQLILSMDYRLSTDMNWYSDLWVQYVLNQFSDVVMNIYKNRLEHRSIV